ncbi:hypothetical protein BC941DRAFT_472739 [Chlamydoabsidia padenii]|nr:hypothetical protein BC941DRAFT_472739 [Chlamydoabsidia padenii]
MDTAHHHHAATASRTQQPLSSSSSGLSSPFINPMPSTGAVPTTTAGPITISLVVALTLVICMILNCGKLRRRVSSQRYNSNVQQQVSKEVIITDEKGPQENIRPSPHKNGSPWSSSSTLLTPHAPAYMPPTRQIVQHTDNNNANLPLHIVSHPRR